MKILLAEDSSSQRRIFMTMLKKMGYEQVVEAGDGAAAWERLSQEPFDMLITDWNMPALNGYQLLEKIRGAPSLAGLPILMVTTVNDQKSIITAVRAGVNNYLTKPFTPEQLKDKIDKALTHSVAQIAQEAADILQNGRQHSPVPDAPYILGALETGTVDPLAKGQDRALFIFVKHVVNAIDRINQDHPGVNLGYCIDEDKKEIVNRLRLTREKTRALLIWTTRARIQDGLTMARLVGRNPEQPISIRLFCDSIADLPEEEYQAIKEMEHITLMEKNEMEFAAIGEMIRAGVLVDLKALQESSPA